jgi:hypothetical protein
MLWAHIFNTAVSSSIHLKTMGKKATKNRKNKMDINIIPSLYDN